MLDAIFAQKKWHTVMWWWVVVGLAVTVGIVASVLWGWWKALMWCVSSVGRTMNRDKLHLKGGGESVNSLERK